MLHDPEVEQVVRVVAYIEKRVQEAHDAWEADEQKRPYRERYSSGHLPSWERYSNLKDVWGNLPAHPELYYGDPAVPEDEGWDGDPVEHSFEEFYGFLSLYGMLDDEAEALAEEFGLNDPPPPPRFKVGDKVWIKEDTKYNVPAAFTYVREVQIEALDNVVYIVEHPTLQDPYGTRVVLVLYENELEPAEEI